MCIPLTRNEHYVSFPQAWIGILTRRLGKFPSYSYHPYSLQSTWLGGRILSCSAGLVYFRCASDAVFAACLWMAFTCLSQQHTGLWDVFLEAYQVLFSAGMPLCLIQTLNLGKSGPNMSSKCFHYLSQNCGLKTFDFFASPLVCLFTSLHKVNCLDSQVMCCDKTEKIP